MAMIHDDELARFLLDDCPLSDVTTDGLGISAVAAQIRMTARDDMAVCGVEEAARMFELSGGTARVVVPSGRLAASGTRLRETKGTWRQWHRTYRMA